MDASARNAGFKAKIALCQPDTTPRSHIFLCLGTQILRGSYVHLIQVPRLPSPA